MSNMFGNTNEIKVTLSFCGTDVLVQSLDSGCEWEFPADDKDRENLQPCETRICNYSIEDNVLIIHY